MPASFIWNQCLENWISRWLFEGKLGVLDGNQWEYLRDFLGVWQVMWSGLRVSGVLMGTEIRIETSSKIDGAMLGLRVDAAEQGSGWWAVLGFRVLYVHDVRKRAWWKSCDCGVDAFGGCSLRYKKQGTCGLKFLHPLLPYVSFWSTPLRFVCCWWAYVPFPW